MRYKKLSKTKEALVHQFTPMIHHIINKLKLKTMLANRDDYVQVGLIALIRAAHGYKKKFKVTFMTYSYVAVLRELMKFYFKDRLIVVPGYALKREGTKPAAEKIFNASFFSIKRDTSSQSMDIDNFIDAELFIKMLTVREQFILRKYFFEGKHYREIGKTQGVSGEMIRQRLRKCFRKIRVEIQTRSVKQEKPSLLTA